MYAMQHMRFALKVNRGLDSGFRRIPGITHVCARIDNLDYKKVHRYSRSHVKTDRINISNLRFPSNVLYKPSIISSVSNLSSDSGVPATSVSRAQLFVQSFPPRCQPYLRLSRIDKPIGTWLLFWPCTWGLTIGAEGLPPLALLTLFGAGAFIMRGAGCTINDMWDHRIDAQVKRTKDRPLAAKELRLRHAAAWLAAQLSVSFWILCQLNTPCLVLGVASLGMVILYPLAKRVTNWPQLVLGFTFNMGVPLGYTAATAASLSYLEFPALNATCGMLYASGILWTLIYDTIYAHQDRQEDAYLGLGSTARRLGNNTKIWLQGFSISMLSCLSTVGYINDFGWPYYLGLSGIAGHLAWQVYTLDIHNHKNCSDRFVANRHIGWLIFLSILGSYWWENGYQRKHEILPLANRKKLEA